MIAVAELYDLEVISLAVDLGDRVVVKALDTAELDSEKGSLKSHQGTVVRRNKNRLAVVFTNDVAHCGK